MDDHSAKLANWLVHNEPDAPVVEISLKGGTYEFDCDSMFAVTGADCRCELDGKEIPQYKTVMAARGDVLSIGAVSKGCYACLGISGLSVPEVMNSASTYTPAAFGGIEGRKLAKGDLLQSADISGYSPEIREIPRKLIPHFSGKITLRAISGPEWEDLDPADREQMLETEYTVAPNSNRMGIRLEADPLKVPELKEMTSSPCCSMHHQNLPVGVSS